MSMMPRVASSRTGGDLRAHGGAGAPVVLVADDDDDLRRLLAFRLQSWGYHVLVAESGLDAVQLLRERHVDAVLLDVEMPGVNGFDVLTASRRGDPDEPAVLMLTARGDGDDVVRGLTSGAEDYLRKPVQVAEVRARLEAVLARRVAGRALRELQAAVQSPTPVSRPGVQVVGVHRPAAGAAAGGDFHCVVGGPDGSTVIALGDVTGHGPPVAATASHLRSVLANHAAVESDPERLLQRLNDSVLAAGDDANSGVPSMATAVCVVWHPTRGVLQWASAGHPPPLLPAHGAPPTTPGVPLGVEHRPRFPITSTRVEAGLLLLHSDGLTEAPRLRWSGSTGEDPDEGDGASRTPRSDEDFGDAAFGAVLEVLARAMPERAEAATLQRSLNALVQGLLAAHQEFSGGLHDDDVTVVACALTAP